MLVEIEAIVMLQVYVTVTFAGLLVAKGMNNVDTITIWYVARCDTYSLH